MNIKPVKIFVSYAHADEDILSQITNHLSGLIRNKSIELWSKKDLLPGDSTEKVRWQKFDEADIILLLVSSDFFADDSICEQEMNRALERNTKGEIRLLFVVVRACDWKIMPIGKIHPALEGKAIKNSEWANIDAPCTKLAQQIREQIKITQIENNRQNTVQAQHPKIAAACIAFRREAGKYLSLRNPQNAIFIQLGDDKTWHFRKAQMRQFEQALTDVYYTPHGLYIPKYIKKDLFKCRSYFHNFMQDEGEIFPLKKPSVMKDAIIPMRDRIMKNLAQEIKKD